MKEFWPDKEEVASLPNYSNNINSAVQLMPNYIIINVPIAKQIYQSFSVIYYPRKPRLQRKVLQNNLAGIHVALF